MILELAIPFFLVAAIYSSTGHGGGSSYIAILLLSGMAPYDAAPIALVLNICVAGLAMAAFSKSGAMPLRLLIPLAAAGAPMAGLGAWFAVPHAPLALLVAPALIATAVALWFQPAPKPRAISWPVLLAAGAGFGLLAGITGIGGGIYLTPLLLMTGWATKAEAAWTSAAFIVINSLVGLATRTLGGQNLAIGYIWLLLPVAVGAALGSFMGSQRYTHVAYRRVLSSLVGIAGLKAVLL